MTNPEKVNSVTSLSRLNLSSLWFWGSAFLLAATLLSMFSGDVANAISGIGDRLSFYSVDFVMTIARLALGPSGALIITTAVLVRATRKSYEADD